VEPEEMERVFNLGVGMVLIVENTAAEIVLSQLRESGTRRRYRRGGAGRGRRGARR